MRIPVLYAVAGGAVAVALVWAWSRGGARAIGQEIGSAVVDTAAGAAVGAVVTVGGTLGIPATDQSACAKAKAEGRTWDASFACPAGDFLSYLWN